MPLQDNDRYLTWNQYSVTRREHDLVGNIGLGQRWRVGGWLLGYNSFYDKVLSESPGARQRWRRSVGRISPPVGKLLPSAGRLAATR